MIEAPPGGFAGPVKRSITIAGHQTSISLEPIFWEALEAAARLLWPTGDRGLGKRLHRVRSETLLVWGERDAIVPASYAKKFSNGISGGTQTRILPCAGHFADFDAPDELAAAIEEFLGD